MAVNRRQKKPHPNRDLSRFVSTYPLPLTPIISVPRLCLRTIFASCDTQQISRVLPCVHGTIAHHTRVCSLSDYAWSVSTVHHTHPLPPGHALTDRTVNPCVYVCASTYQRHEERSSPVKASSDGSSPHLTPISSRTLGCRTDNSAVTVLVSHSLRVSKLIEYPSMPVCNLPTRTVPNQHRRIASPVTF
jgi:hypothetical protein